MVTESEVILEEKLMGKLVEQGYTRIKIKDEEIELKKEE